MAPVCGSDGWLNRPIVIESLVIVFADAFAEAQSLLPGYLANFFSGFIIDDFNDEILGFGIYTDSGFIFRSRKVCIVRRYIVVIRNDFYCA